MLRIYGYAASINVRKVLWTCAELTLHFEREDWAGPFHPTSDPAFLSLNPLGMVPVIDDDGAIIWSKTRWQLATARRICSGLNPRSSLAGPGFSDSGQRPRHHGGLLANDYI